MDLLVLGFGSVLVACITVYKIFSRHIDFKTNEQYKGKYMRARKEFKELAKELEAHEAVTSEDFFTALSEGEEELLETVAKELGIPKQVINFGLKHPDKVAPIIEKITGAKLPLKEGKKAISDEEQFLS